MKTHFLCPGLFLSRVFGGFFAGRLYRTLKGHRWKKGAFCVSLLVFCANCPGLMMARSVDKLPVYLWVAEYNPGYTAKIWCGRSPSRFIKSTG